MRRSIPSLLALLSLLCLPAAAAHAATIVAPNGLETVDGNDGNSFPFNNFEGRYQQAYASAQFPSGVVSISEIAFRTDTDPAAADWSSLLTFTMRMSTSANPVGSLSNVFADNIGADEIEVFDVSGGTFGGSNAGGPAPNAWDLVLTLDTPFVYDTSAGDLLLEVLMDTNTNLIPPAGFSYLDAMESTTGTYDIGIQRLFNSTGDVGAVSGNLDTEGYGLVTRFTYTVVPEPGTGLLLAAGLVALAARRRS